MFAVKKKKRDIQAKNKNTLSNHINFIDNGISKFLIPIKLLNWVSKIQPDDLCKLPYHPPWFYSPTYTGLGV